MHLEVWSLCGCESYDDVILASLLPHEFKLLFACQFFQLFSLQIVQNFTDAHRTNSSLNSHKVEKTSTDWSWTELHSLEMKKISFCLLSVFLTPPNDGVLSTWCGQSDERLRQLKMTERNSWHAESGRALSPDREERSSSSKPEGDDSGLFSSPSDIPDSPALSPYKQISRYRLFVSCILSSLSQHLLHSFV